MRWRRFLHRSEQDAQIVSDLQSYLDTETEDNIARGMSPEGARAAARRKLGNPTLIREDIYRMNSIGFVETTWQDLRYALRTMSKSPTFALTVVLTLALGIGANTAIFSVIRAVLLKPLEYRDPGRLVRLSLENPRQNKYDRPLTLMRLEELRKSAKSFSGIGAFLKYQENVSLSGHGEPEALKSARLSANVLDILDVKPLLGRGFLAEEDTTDGPPVVMISAGLWRRRFQGDPQVVGKVAMFNATPYTIIGVLPDGFAFPFGGTDLWFTRPAEWSVLPSRFWFGLTPLNGLARLKPQVTLSQANAELDVLNQQYIFAHPERLDAGAGETMRAVPMKDRLVADVRPMLWMLFGAVGFVLFIACANVAGLLLARANFRSRELAVRAAVGASRGRLVRQLSTESLMLAGAGGALGVLLAKLGLNAVRHFGPLNLPRAGEIRLDGSVLVFTMALSTAAGLLCGLFPSLQASRREIAAELRESGVGARGGSSARRRVFGLNARGLLVVGQIALSIILLIGATLLMKSFARLRSVDPGFQSANLLTMKISLPLTRYDTDPKKAAFFSELVERVSAVPGAIDATVAMSLPTANDWLATNISIEGQPSDDSGRDSPSARLQSITPGYLRTLKIPLRRGRDFTQGDNSPGTQPVAIINESFVRRFWPTYPLGQDPVGQHLREGIDKTGWVEIVGIVGDVNEGGLDVDPGPEFYVPTVMHAPQTAYLAVRTERDPSLFFNAIRNQVLAIDKDQAVSDVRTMDEVLEATFGPLRLTMLLLGSFAAVALLLAVVGMYGVIAYSVAQRTQEVGIRRALGAQQANILRLVLSHGLGLALLGAGIGVGGAFALTRIMNSLLFHVSATDPPTFVTVALLFVIVALVASYIPARRAARVDPMAALRVG